MVMTEERKAELKQQRIENLARGRAQAAAKRTLLPAEPPRGSIPFPKFQPDRNDNGNGHKTLLEEQIEKENKDKKPPPIIIPSQLNAFSHDRGTQAVDYIVRTGDKIRDLLMRANFPDTIQTRALARHVAKCVEFHCDRAIEEALDVVASDVSVGGESRRQLIQAIIGGDPRSVSKGRMTFSDKVKKAAFGNKKDKEDVDNEK